MAIYERLRGGHGGSDGFAFAKHHPRLESHTKAKLLAFPPPNKKTRRTRVVLFGGGQTRTDELRRGGIYSPLQLPLCDTPVRKKCVESKGCWRKDLNPQPSAYKADALPLSYTSTEMKKSNTVSFLISRNLQASPAVPPQRYLGYLLVEGIRKRNVSFT